MFEIPALVALDVETTGLKPEEGDRICEICLIKFDSKGNIVKEYSTLVNPQRDIPGASTAVNGITEERVKGKPSFKDIASDVYSFMKDEILLIHNAPFDISFLRKEFENANMEFPETEVIDSLFIARKFFNFPSNSLDNLAVFYNIIQDNPHRAESDVKTLYEIFRRLNQEAEMEEIPLSDILQSTEDIDVILSPEEVLPLPLLNALKTHRDISIRYINGKGEVSVRIIRPLEVCGNNYLKAMCYKSNEERTFRLDRIKEVMENVT
jgi:DNA polymerase III subunit epsilon